MNLALLVATLSAFNLTCGSDVTALTDASEKPIANEFRINLQEQLWCSGTCLRVTKIAAVSENSIVLSFESAQDYRTELAQKGGSYRLTISSAGKEIISSMCEQPTVFAGFND